jgi:pentatricopeptide repeat protein
MQLEGISSKCSMLGSSSFCFHTEWANFEDALDMFSEMLASDENTAQSAHLELVNKCLIPKMACIRR